MRDTIIQKGPAARLDGLQPIPGLAESVQIPRYDNGIAEFACMTPQALCITSLARIFRLDLGRLGRPIEQRKPRHASSLFHLPPRRMGQEPGTAHPVAFGKGINLG